jgi:hydrogenase nickel incorporation protein HypA/HybF
MHELSVCLSLLEQVERIGRAHGARRVEKILLRVGPLSGVETPLLKNAFPLAVANTIAEQAELVIEPAPVRVRCSRCGAETEAKPNQLVCGRCGDYHTRLLSGDEMLLQQIEFAVEDEPASEGPGGDVGET